MPFVIAEDSDRPLIDDYEDFSAKFPPMTHKHSNYNRLVRGAYGGQNRERSGADQSHQRRHHASPEEALDETRVFRRTKT